MLTVVYVNSSFPVCSKTVKYRNILLYIIVKIFDNMLFGLDTNKNLIIYGLKSKHISVL